MNVALGARCITAPRFAERHFQLLPGSLSARRRSDKDVGRAPIFQLRYYLQPELGAFSLRDPQPQHFFQALDCYPNRQVNRLVDMPAVSHFELDRVEIHDRINRVQLPVVSRLHLVNYFVGDAREQRRRHFHVVDLFEVLLDLRVDKRARVQRNDVLVSRRSLSPQ